MDIDENIDVIDLGSCIVPTSWKDITLKTYEEIERYYDSVSGETQFNVLDVLDILIDKDRDFIMSLPQEFLMKILDKLSFLQTAPESKEPSNSIVIDGEKYSINFMEKLKLGEYVSADGVLKNDPHNYAAILAILCRKQGEVYDSKYEAEIFEDRVKMWEKQPVIDILPIVSFFLQLCVQSEILSRLYTTVEEAIDHTQQSIDSSDRIGVWRKLYLNWRVRNLKRSLKSSKNTSQMHLRSLPISLRKELWKRKKKNTSR